MSRMLRHAGGTQPELPSTLPACNVRLLATSQRDRRSNRCSGSNSWRARCWRRLKTIWWTEASICSHTHAHQLLLF